MKSIRLFPFVALLIVLLSVAFFVHATCVPGDTGTTGNDTITCDTANQPVVDVEGLDGDDLITIDAGVVSSSNLIGDNASTLGTGNDTLVNDGSVNLITGDALTSGNGTGSDTVINNGTTNYIYGDAAAGAGSGSDVVVNNGTVNNDVVGDSFNGTGSGNDTIINNGTISVFLIGDSSSNTGTGSDAITNNGVVGNSIYGDSRTGGGGADDTITNNGGVGLSIVGDGDNIGTGNDVITNNGTVGSIFADSVVGATNSGNDTIINNGTANNVFGDGQFNTGTGNDTITNNGTVNNSILAGGGTDLVIIGTNTATVGGTIDGGAGYDTLTFNLTSTDPAVLLDAAQRIAAANPSGGTITLGGHTYTWLNFEELTQLLFSLTRLNGLMDPVAVFCSLYGGIDVYNISGQQGIFSLHVGSQSISNALVYAQAYDDSVVIGASGTSSLWALPTGEIQARTPDGYSFNFRYELYCGALPVGVAADYPASGARQTEEELPDFTIINQAYGG